MRAAEIIIRWTARLGVVTAILGVWWLVTLWKLLPSIYLPSPFQAFQALVVGLTRGSLVLFTLATMKHMLLGWMLATLCGIGIGALVGAFLPIRRLLLPTLELIRALPASSMIPVAIAFLGLSESMLLFVIAFGSVWPVLLATVHGIAIVDLRLREVARLLGVSPLSFIFKFGLPNAMPDIISGMRLSLTAALITAIVGEMLTSQSGLGATIMLAARTYRSPDLYAGIILLGCVGALNNGVLAVIERRALPWRQT